MSRVQVTKCDGCGRETPDAETDGWMKFRAELTERGATSSPMLDVCPICTQKPLREMMEAVLGRELSGTTQKRR